MSFARFYESPWQQPGLLLSLALIGLAYAFTVRSRVRAALPFVAPWLAVFGVEIALDAVLTANTSPLPPSALGVAAIVFVIVGDLRFYALAERLSSPENSRGWIARTLAWSLVASVLTGPASRLAPAMFPTTRHVFLAYESVSLVLALAWRFAVLPRRWARVTASPVARELADDAMSYMAVMYALWVASDVLILTTGADGAWLLRVAPNVLYYGLFTAFVAWRASRSR